MERPPISSWPPFLVRFAVSERRIRPAHVPQVGWRWTLIGLLDENKIVLYLQVG